VGERLPLQELAVSARRFDQVNLVLVELAGCLLWARVLRRAQAARNVTDHVLHAVSEQIVLLVFTQAQLYRAGGRTEVNDRLPDLAKPCPVEDPLRGLPHGECGERRGILTLELL